MEHTGSAASLELDTPSSSASLCSLNPLGLPVAKGLADSDTNAGSSLAASASQGESGSASGADNSPTSGEGKKCRNWASVNAPSWVYVDAPSSPTINDPPLVQLIHGAPSLLDRSEDINTADEDEESGEESECAIAPHEDSFYASLIAAQQLRRQRDAVAHIGSRGSVGAPSSTHTSTEKSDSCNVGPLSPKSHHSRAQSAAVVSASISSQNGSQPPRTLQELLAWRQELLEARLREQALVPHQQQQLPSTACFSRSLRSNASQQESSQHSSCTSLRTPGLNSPPSQSLSTRPASSHFPLLSTPLQPEEHTLVPNDLHLKSAALPTWECRPVGRLCVSSSQRRTASQPPSVDAWMAQRPPPHPFTTTTPVATPLSQPSSQVREEKERLRRLLETAELLRMHDNGLGHSSFGRPWVLLLFVIFLTCFYYAPFFPGGLIGIL